MNYLEFKTSIIKEYYQACTKQEIREILSEYRQTVEDIVTDLESGKHKSLKDIEGKLHYHACVYSYIGFQNLYIAFKNLEHECRNTAASVQEILPGLNKIIEAVKMTDTVLENIIKEDTFFVD
jgi:hypothetical protein